MTGKNKFYLLVLLLSFSGYGWILWNLFNAGIYQGSFNPCLFRKITGIPCPSCGTTHSVLSIIKGDFGVAFYQNPFGFLLAMMLVVIPVWIIIDLITRRESFLLFYKRAENFLRMRWVAIPAIILVLVIWILNIIRM